MLNKSRNRLFSLGVLTIVTALIMAACASAAPVEEPVAPAAPAAMPTADTSSVQKATIAIPVTGGGVILNVANDDKLGKYLVDGNGMTLYLYTKDTPGVSTCTAACLAKWPAFTASSVDQIAVGPGVDKTKLGLADLSDGKKIVTYNKMPLYYWVNDKKPGDTTGQNVGGVWFVVAP